MDPHKLGCFAAVHAGIQHKCLQCFQKLFALIFTGFLKRFQQFDIVFLDESALDLDVDAVAYQSQFIFGKNPFVREGPAFADKTICISRTFDPIETSDMEDPRTLIALEPVEKLHTAVFQIGPGNFVFVSQDHSVSFIAFCDLHDIEVFLLFKLGKDLALHLRADPFREEHAQDIISADPRLILEGVCQALVASHEGFDEFRFRITFRCVFPHAHGQFYDLCELGDLTCCIGILVVHDKHVVFFVVYGHRTPVGKHAVDIDHGVCLGVTFYVSLFPQLDGVGYRCLMTCFHREDRIEILAEYDQLKIVADGSFPYSRLEIAVFFKVQQMEYRIADQSIPKVVSVQHPVHHFADRLGVSCILRHLDQRYHLALCRFDQFWRQSTAVVDCQRRISTGCDVVQDPALRVRVFLHPGKSGQQDLRLVSFIKAQLIFAAGIQHRDGFHFIG